MVRAKVYDSDGNTLSTLMQYDRGITIYIKSGLVNENCVVHFAAKDDDQTLTVETEYEDGVLSATIPDDLLEESGLIIGYVYLVEDDLGQTVITFEIRVAPRPKPSDVVYSSEDDYLTITSILEQLETAVETVEAAQASIEEILAQVSEYASAASESAAAAAESAALAQEYLESLTGSSEDTDDDSTDTTDAGTDDSVAGDDTDTSDNSMDE